MKWEGVFGRDAKPLQPCCVGRPVSRLRINQLFGWMNQPAVNHDQWRVKIAKEVPTRDSFSANVRETLPTEKLWLPHGNVTDGETKSVPYPVRLTEAVSATG